MFSIAKREGPERGDPNVRFWGNKADINNGRAYNRPLILN